MHFDDRLGTVLRIRADGEGMRRIQFRQLLDLLGTLPAEARGEQIDSAFVRLGELANTLSAEQCAAILGETGLRVRSARLVATLAASAPALARAALSRAELSDEQWLDLLPALPPAARVHLRDRADVSAALKRHLSHLGVHQRGLPQTSDGPVLPIESAPNAARPDVTAETGGEAPTATQLHGISELVKRIEAYRKAREGLDHRPAGDSPRLPLGEEHAANALRSVQAFDFATDPAGQINWSDAGVASMVIGLRLAARDGSSGITAGEPLIDALRLHQPLHAAAVSITGAPAIAGRWLIDATPWFDPLTGQHMGWRGRMRRPADGTATDGAVPASAAPPRDSEAERIRQLLHELRTPINAVQGFAEVIQQQLFGPTPHAYRALAANIAGDAAQLLSAFDELERLAKLDSAAIVLEAGETDAGAVFAATVAQLDAHLRARGSGLTLRSDAAALPILPVPLARIEVERLAWRVLATLGGACAPGEILYVRLRAKNGAVQIGVSLPAALANRTEDDLFKASAGQIEQVIAAGIFGVGFALRLARAEAQAAGGTLQRADNELQLTLPSFASVTNHAAPTNAAQ